ncbi:ATP phosphoribosyltransferase [Oscillospiraceae bacterium MB08-C2-2]|nr:ATP phosphoribosyltransferase [Oscillospiraceae bacterium MB08-C2-2]
MLSIALPKGRLSDKVYGLMSRIGYNCESFLEDSRKLVIEDTANGFRYFLVKPSDVAIYVERGAADAGVVGKDILLESQPDVYELLNLGLGRCRMAVCAPNGYEENSGLPLRVATKYVNITKQYYSSQNREIEIIKLNGSIELAPILHLSDVIVDIVETGSTLKENDMKVLGSFLDISARFIANKASYKFKYHEINTLAEKLREVSAL